MYMLNENLLKNDVLILITIDKKKKNLLAVSGLPFKNHSTYIDGSPTGSILPSK